MGESFFSCTSFFHCARIDLLGGGGERGEEKGRGGERRGGRGGGRGGREIRRREEVI